MATLLRDMAKAPKVRITLTRVLVEFAVRETSQNSVVFSKTLVMEADVKSIDLSGSILLANYPKGGNR